MGLDLDSVDRDKLSSALGTGDWAIALPLGYPDFVIPLAWRARQRARIGRLFVRWVMGGYRIEIVHYNDPSWDHSGQARRIRTHPDNLLMRYEKLGHWMQKEPTGNSEATFESHYGLNWPTYGEDLNDEIERALYALLEATFPTLRDDEKQWDEMVDVITWGFTPMADVIRRRIGTVSTEEAWIRYERGIRFQMEVEAYNQEKAAARRKAMSVLVNDFWQQHFPDLMRVRLDKIVYHENNLEKRLTELFADAPPTLLEALIEVTIPAMTSNSVDEEIRFMARAALGKE